MIPIEKALTNHNNQSPYEWFINQNHIPLGLSSDANTTYNRLYQQFLQELYQIYLKTDSKYYWFTSNGKLVGDEGSQVISSNNIRLNKSLLRNIKLEELLNTN